MTEIETGWFNLLEQYARSRHHCFLAEFFRDPNRADYILCFRPESVESESQERYACKYFQLSERELLIGDSAELSTEVVRKLDCKLAGLSHS